MTATKTIAGRGRGGAIAAGWLAVRRFHWRIHTPALWLSAICFFGFLIAGACGVDLKGTWWEIAACMGYAYGLIVSWTARDPDAPRPEPAVAAAPKRCACCGQTLPND